MQLLDSDSRLAKHFMPHQIAWIQAENAIHEQRRLAVALAEKSVRIGWTGLQGAQDALHGLQSEYIFNYPVENVHASWTSALGRAVTLNNTVQIAQRYRQTAYPVWNASLAHDTGKLRPYLRLANISNTGYQEIQGVAMPGRSISGGFALQLGR